MDAEYLKMVLADLKHRRDTHKHTSVDLDWIIKRLEKGIPEAKGGERGGEAPKPEAYYEITARPWGI